MAIKTAVVTVPVQYEAVPGSLAKVAKELEAIAKNKDLSTSQKQQILETINFAKAKAREYETAMISGSKIKIVDAERITADMEKTEAVIKNKLKNIIKDIKENSPTKALEEELESYREKLGAARKDRAKARAEYDVKKEFTFMKDGAEIKIPGMGNTKDIEKYIPKLQALNKEGKLELTALKEKLALEKDPKAQEALKEKISKKEQELKLQKEALRAAQKQYELETLPSKQRFTKAVRKEKLYQGKIATTTTALEAEGGTVALKAIRTASDANKKFGNTVEETNKAIQQQSTELEKTKQTLNTFQSNISSTITRLFGFRAAYNFLRRTIRQAIVTIEQLSQSFTEIAMVTTYTTKEVWKMKNEFVRIANVTGMTVVEVSKITGEFFKQGRSLSEVMKLTEAAGIAAKIAGISAGDSVKYLTSAINGYQLSANQAMAVSDKFATLASVSATDYEELAIAMSKVAAQAYSAGVSMDNMMGFIAKALETTREAPENIGTAFKTIFARMSELKDFGKTVEDGMDVNRVAKALDTIGVSLTDQQNQIRNLDEVLIEVGYKWKDLTKNQKAYIATTLAGTRQQTRLLAVFEDFDRTMELAQASSDSLGASFAMQDKYYTSVGYAINTLQVAWQNFITELLKSEAIIWFYNTLAGIVSNIDVVSRSLNGMGFWLMTIAGIITGKVIASLLQMSLAAVAEAAVTNKRQKEYEELTKAINDKNNETIKDALITRQNTLVSEGGIAVTSKEIAMERTKQAVTKESIALKLKMIATTLAYVAVAAVLVYSIMAIGHALNEAAENQKKFIDGQKELNSKAFNAKKASNDVKNLVNKYNELDKKLVKTAEDYDQMIQYAEQIQDIGGEAYQLATNGELDLDAIQKFQEDREKIISESWDNIEDGILGRFGSLKEAYNNSNDALIQGQALTAEALRQSGKESMAEFNKLDAASQKFFREMAKTTIQIDTVMTINGEEFDPNNPSKMGAKTREAFQNIANQQTLTEVGSKSLGVQSATAAGAATGAVIGSAVPIIGTAVGALAGAAIAGAGALLVNGIDTLHDMSAEAVAEEYQLYLQNKAKFDELDWFNPDTWHWPWDKSQRAKMKKDFEKLDADLKAAEEEIEKNVIDMASAINKTDFGAKSISEQYKFLQDIGYFTNPEAAAKIKETIPEVENLTKVMGLLGSRFIELKDKINMSGNELNKWFSVVDSLEVPDYIKKGFLKDTIVYGAAAAVNALSTSVEGLQMNFDDLLSIQQKVVENLSKLSVQDLSYLGQGLQSIYTNLEKVNNMLLGGEKMDLAYINEMLQLYPQLADIVREKGRIEISDMETIAANDKQDFIDKMKYERALVQSQLDAEKIRLEGLKFVRDTVIANGEIEKVVNQEVIDAEMKAWLEAERAKVAVDSERYRALTAQIAIYNAKTGSGQKLDLINSQISESEARISSLTSELTTYDVGIAAVEAGLFNATKAADEYISSITKIKIIEEALNDLEGDLAVLRSETELLTGAEYLANKEKELETLKATNILLEDQNQAYEDANDLLLNNLSPALKDSVEIIGDQLYITEDYVKLSGEQKKVVDEMMKTYNENSSAIDKNSASINNNIKALEELKKANLEMVDKTKQLVIDAIKSEYNTRKEYAEKAYDVEKAWLDKRKSLYEESFDTQEYEQSLADLQKEREVAIKRLSQLEGSANTTAYKEALDKKQQLDVDINSKIYDRNKQSLLKSLSDTASSLDQEKQITNEFYEDKINNMAELEARAVEIINSGVDQTLEYLKANSEEYKNATAEAKQLMLDEWTDYVSQTNLLLSGIDMEGIDFTGFIQDINDAATAAGMVATRLADAKKTLSSLVVKDNKDGTYTIGEGNYDDGFDAAKDATSNQAYFGGWDQSSAAPTITSQQIRNGWNALIDQYGDSAWWSRDDYNILKDYAKKYPEVTKAVGSNIFGPNIRKYSEGGLVKTTGLQMLHGSNTKPERVLSPVQTELFDKMVSNIEALNNKGGEVALGGVSIESIVIQTPQLNSNLDFATAGNTLATAFKEAISQRGLNINKKR